MINSHQVFTATGQYVATLKAEGNPTALDWHSPDGLRTFALVSGRYVEVKRVTGNVALPNEDR